MLFFIPTVDQDRNTKRVDLRTAITPRKGNIQTVRFHETGANYYDRDARPSLHESENTSRPIIQYDDVCYVEVDVWKPDENLTNDKDNQTKASKGEDDGISVETNVKGESKENRKVKVETPGTKRSETICNRSNSFSTMFRNIIEPKNNSGNITKIKKRHHSPDRRQKEALPSKRSKHKSTFRHDNDLKSSTRQNVYKYRTSSHKGHTIPSTSDLRIVQKKHINDRNEGSSGRKNRHRSLREHSSRCDKSASPILFKKGKRATPKRGSRSPSSQETDLRSYSPISDRSLSPPPRQNQEKRFPATTFNATDKVPIYSMLVKHLSRSSKKYLTPHEIHTILNSDPVLSPEQEKALMQHIRQNDNLFVSKFMGTSIGIWPKTHVEICSAPQKDDQCNDLHICKYDMLSKCNAKYCRFGHELFNNHNLKVLKLFSLDGFDKDQIRRLMQTKESRNMSTLPLICKFYNNEGGCNRFNCKHLHVCSHFITKKCKFQQRCKRSHKLFVGQPFEILEEHGMSNYGDATIIELISKTLEDGNVKLKREITTGVELSTMEETKKSTKTCTTIAGLRNNNSEGRQMSKKTTKVNFQNVKSQDFIPIVDPDDSSDSEAMLVDSKDNIHRIDKIKSENTDDECKQKTTETGDNSKLLNIFCQKGNSIAETRISECRNKSVSKSDTRSISLSYEVERDEASVPIKDGIPCSIHIECGEEELQTDKVALANRNLEANQNNSVVQHREDGLTGVKTGDSTFQSVHIDESTSIDTDIFNKRELRLSSTQSINKLQNQLMGKNDNECDANSGNGGDDECDANSGNGGNNECDTNSDNGGDNECDANSGNCGDKECDANSGNGGVNKRDANSGNGGDNECDANSGKGGDNECDANSGKGGDNECDAISWNGSNNECIANTGNGSDNECNANTGNVNSENGCITECDNRNSSNTNADDWPIFEELSMEYKRYSSTRKIRFRHNSGNWQIATSSGMWKELDSADASVINNVANVCDKYAQDN